MADIIVPSSLPISSISWGLKNTSRGGGVSLTGQEQIVSSPTGRWGATATFSIFTGIEDASVLVYRNLIRRGRATTIILPDPDARGPAHYAGITIPRRGVRYSDEMFHSDGAGFDQLYSAARLGSGASLNDTLIDIQISGGLTILPGMRFSTPDDRMHEIDEIVDYDGRGGFKVLIAPWFRSSYGISTTLDFDHPRCRMRLASDDTGALTVGQRTVSTPTIEFVEAY